MTPAPTPAAVAAGVESASALAEVAWHELTAPEALAAAAGLARIKACVDGALVALTEQLTASDAPAAAGWASTKDFLTHLLGAHKGAGGSLVRVAQQTRDLPRVREGMHDGSLSLAQASVIGQRVTALPRVPAFRDAVAHQLVDLVTEQGLDATDLHRAAPGVIEALDPDGAVIGTDLTLEKAERGAHQARFLSFATDRFGGVRIKGYATVEEAEHVKVTLMPLAAPVTTEPGACGGTAGAPRRDPEGRRLQPGCPDPTCAHDGRDPREAGARLWDALVDACTRLQATESLPQAHGTTARITVTVDHDTLRSQLEGPPEATAASRATGAATPEGHGLLGSGDRLSAAAVRRLACDAEILPAVLGTRGELLDLGRSQRLVNTALWLALVLRDRHCSFPGCTRLPVACDAHHIVAWADGGPTSLDNLVLLCRRHHTRTHHSPWQVTLDADTRRPVWRPPPAIDDRDRFTYHPATRPPPHAA